MRYNERRRCHSSRETLGKRHSQESNAPLERKAVNTEMMERQFLPALKVRGFLAAFL